MREKKRYTFLAVILAAMCMLSACSLTDKKETTAAESREHMTEKQADPSDKEKTSEGVLESVGEDLKDGAESMGEDLKNGAESVGEDLKDGAESMGEDLKDGAERAGDEMKDHMDTTEPPSEPMN